MRIQVVNLCKRFGKVSLFENLNLDLNSGKLICIYGASGCGKTTLLNMLGFIEPYNEGSILIDGKEIKHRDVRKLLQNEIGFVFQDYGLIENETVEQNFLIVKRISKLKHAKAKIEEALVNVNLDKSFMKRKIYELSGGEQQRVTVAKMLLKNPAIILADEPTASLDEDNKQIILDFLKECALRGKLVIIVSHDPKIIEFCDEAIDLAALKGQK